MEFFPETIDVDQKFNVGLSTTMRLHNLLLFLNQLKISSELEKYQGWKDALDALYFEILPLIEEHFNKEKISPHKKEIDLAREKVHYEFNIFAKRISDPRMKQVKVEELINNLETFERFLRLVMHKRNLLFPKKDEAQY